MRGGPDVRGHSLGAPDGNWTVDMLQNMPRLDLVRVRNWAFKIGFRTGETTQEKWIAEILGKFGGVRELYAITGEEPYYPDLPGYSTIEELLQKNIMVSIAITMHVSVI